VRPAAEVQLPPQPPAAPPKPDNGAGAP
jgi:hypothetical protein